MEEGLYSKYIITKADGSEVIGDYFVLKFSDKKARIALMMYAEELLKEDSNSSLAHDLANKIAKYMACDA